jgi:putative membrane protein
MLGALWSALVYWIVASVVIFIVGKMNFGLKVNSFVSAMIAALVIAIIGGLIVWVLGLFGIALTGGWLAAIINLIVAAAVLMLSDRFVSGMEVHGFGGALIAAIAIGVVGWLILWFLGLFGIVI